MSINKTKTKFMVINNTDEDKVPITSDGFIVTYCTSYLYLGAYITDDASYRTSITMHINDKKKHYLKYVSFLVKNPDLPFTIKKKVAEACVLTTILYGCETWFNYDCRKLEIVYMGIIKALLSVRKTTCNDLCLIESGIPSLQAMIRNKQYKYMDKKLTTIEDGSPLKFVLDLVAAANTASHREIIAIRNYCNVITEENQKICDKIRCDIESSKRVT